MNFDNLFKCVAVDERCPKECINTLQNLGISVILVPCSRFFDKAVCGHADMNVLNIDGKVFTYQETKHLFENCEIVDREEQNLLKYPYDVGLNCAILGKKMVCNTKYCNKKVLEYAKIHGFEIIHINQGYAKCNICVVCGNAVITEDKGIFEVLSKKGIDCLLLNNHEVKLDGYGYGFIGGASGKISDNTLAFCGCIQKHTQYNEIKSFCEKYNIQITSLSDDDLYDVGSIIRIY